MLERVKLSEAGIPNETILKQLTERQSIGIMHEYTCCSENGCKHTGPLGDRRLMPVEKDGLVVFACPCGVYVQDWAYKSDLTADYEAIRKAAREKGFKV